MRYRLARSILFRFAPEKTHHFILGCLNNYYSAERAERSWLKVPACPVVCAGITFPNPVGLSAGFDNNGDYIQALSSMGFGFIELGGVTPLAQSGNTKPRLFRLVKSRALINRMGFPNKGVDYLCHKLATRSYRGVIGVNIAKNMSTSLDQAADDYTICMKKLYPLVDYMTVNISSPNTPGLRELQKPEMLNALLQELKQTQLQLRKEHHKNIPLFIKVAPDLDQDTIEVMAELFINHQIEAIVTHNTTIHRDGVIDLNQSEKGGLSGQPLFSRACEVQKLFYRYVGDRIPIIAGGGVMNPTCAIDKFLGGARLVQVYTGLIYYGPRLVRDIIAQWQKYYYPGLDNMP